MENATPQPKKMALWKKIVIGFVILIIIGQIGKSCEDNKPISQTKTSSSSVSQDSETNSSPSIPTENWHYDEEKDKMTDVVNHYATTESTNTIDFDFPYNGGSTFALSIRKQDGRPGVVLTVDKGQFIGGIGRDGAVKVKFDDQPAVNYPFGSAADGSADVIFIGHEKRFISNLKKTNKLLIEAEFYQAGKKIIEFDVAGLKWDK